MKLTLSIIALGVAVALAGPVQRREEYEEYSGYEDYSGDYTDYTDSSPSSSAQPSSSTAAPSSSSAAPSSSSSAPSTPTNCGDSKYKMGADGKLEKKTPQVQGIVGGFTTDERGQIPYQISLMSCWENGQCGGCGGSIIDATRVLTAAHCVRNDAKQLAVPAKSAVTAGGFSLQAMMNGADSVAQTIKIAKILVHPKYETGKGMYADVAILTLAEPIKFSEDVQPICLPSAGVTVDTYKQGNDKNTFIVSGWGSQGKGQPETDKLKYTVVKQVDNGQCTEMYKKWSDLIDGSQICASGKIDGKMTDSCQGDSGGPLAVYRNGKWELAGVVSHGNECAHENYPGAYASVPYFLTWIKQNL